MKWVFFLYWTWKSLIMNIQIKKCNFFICIYKICCGVFWNCEKVIFYIFCCIWRLVTWPSHCIISRQIVGNRTSFWHVKMKLWKILRIMKHWFIKNTYLLTSVIKFKGWERKRFVFWFSGNYSFVKSIFHA